MSVLTKQWNAQWLRRPKFTQAERIYRDEAFANERLIVRNIQIAKDCWDRGLPDDRWDRDTTEMGIVYLFDAVKTLATALERIEAKLDALKPTDEGRDTT